MMRRELALSDRQRAEMKEYREFVKAEADKQRLSEDQEGYQQYIASLEVEQLRVPRAFRVEPLSFEEWRKFCPQNESDPVLRGAKASNLALLTRACAEDQKEQDELDAEVRAGRPDPLFLMPENAKKLRMDQSQAYKFEEKQVAIFIKQTPEYFPCRKNADAIRDYLIAQGAEIANIELLRLAFKRLSALGLLEQRPAPAPTPAPITRKPEPKPAEPQDEFIGFDLQTGERRKFSQFEVDRMSAQEFKRVFRIKPVFTAGYYGVRQ
jgi:hypothetical protein